MRRLVMIEPVLISGPGVWMESEATRQLAAVCELAGCVHVAGMPDLHPGRGFPIGAVVATRGVLHPHLVGGDAGCGARVVATRETRCNPDWLERRVRAAFEAPLFEAAPGALFDAVWHCGPRGLLDVAGVPDELQQLAAREPDDDAPPSGDPAPYRDDRDFGAQLGTIGGGNHFAEIAKVGRVASREAAEPLGLKRDAHVVVAHSGSRGLGAALAARWRDALVDRTAVSDDDAQARYLGELAGAVRFARASRLVLAYRLLAALGALRERSLTGSFDVTHNDVRRERVAGDDAWIHRKGAAPAPAGAPTIVLGSRGTPSWILEGTGAEAGLASVAHGAGRKMTRSEAIAKLGHRYRRRELARTELGSRVVCDDPQLLFEEHPDAYKAIEPIIAALEAHGQARRIAELIPVITVKL